MYIGIILFSSNRKDEISILGFEISYTHDLIDIISITFNHEQILTCSIQTIARAQCNIGYESIVYTRARKNPQHMPVYKNAVIESIYVTITLYSTTDSNQSTCESENLLHKID